MQGLAGFCSFWQLDAHDDTDQPLFTIAHHHSMYGTFVTFQTDYTILLQIAPCVTISLCYFVIKYCFLRYKQDGVIILQCIQQLTVHRSIVQMLSGPRQTVSTPNVHSLKFAIGICRQIKVQRFFFLYRKPIVCIQ